MITYTHKKLHVKDATTIHTCDVDLYREVNEKDDINVLNAYGSALSLKFYNFGDTDYFFTSNDEYSSPVHYCPFCGLDLRTLLNK